MSNTEYLTATMTVDQSPEEVFAATKESPAAESECFEPCSRGWTFYITTNLPQLIATGASQPIPSYRR